MDRLATEQQDRAATPVVPPRVKYLPEEVQQAIVRAKLEWESIADSLPLLVCLLNEERQALRVNRIIETWHLGRVNEVTGRDMHALLHPRGCPVDCSLRSRLDRAWASVQGGAAAEFEISDACLGRTVSVALRP